MTRTRACLLFTAALLLALAWMLHRTASGYEARMAALPAVHHRWEQHIENLRRARDGARSALAAASASNPGALAADVDATLLSDPTLAGEVERWVRQARQLKQLFQERPDQQIPELAILGPRDWLRLARRVKLDTPDDVERALSIARNQATGTFIQWLSHALQQYARANQGMLPTDPADLQPLVGNGLLGPDLFARYEMLKTGTLSEAGDGPLLRSREVIDDKFDHGVSVVQRDGKVEVSTSQHEDPEDSDATGPLEDDLRRDAIAAAKAYIRANGTPPQSPAQLVPYFDPPLGPMLTEHLNRPLTPEQQQGFENDMAKLLK